MRNLKKLLALVLAMVMAFSLMLSASAANGDYDKYTDKETITEEFQTAVNVLSGLDVLKGDGPDDAKTFRPADTLTRAEAAVIVYRVATGDVSDQQTALYADYNHFADVSKDDWFAGYVGFCQNAGIIKGTTPTTFSPYEKVSGYQLLAMLLRVIGYGKNNEFTGTNWQVNTAAMAESLRLTDTVKEANFASTLNRDARRDVVAELTFRTMILPATVTYTPSLAYNEYTTIGGTEKNPTQGYKIFRLVEKPVVLEDDWGRPNDTWYCDGVNSMNKQYDKTPDKIVAEVTWTPVATYNTAKTECDIIHENTDWSKDTSKTISSAYLNGAKRASAKFTPSQDDPTDSDDNNATIEALGTRAIMGAQGRILEIYDMSKSFNYGDGQTATETGVRVVEIDTYLGQVVKVTAAGTDKNGHPTDATIDVDVYPGGGELSDRVHVDEANGCPVATHTLRTNNNHHKVWDFNGVKAEGYTVGQYVLVYVNQDRSGWTDAQKSKFDATSFVTNYFTIGGDVVNEDETSNVKAAEIKNGGFVQTYTNTTATSDQPDTTTVGATVYKDASKFCCNWRVTGTPWSVAVDRYGNAIGLVSINSYLAIEKLEWKHGAGFGDDFALADVLTASGERMESVKIRDVNNISTTNASGTGAVDGAGVLNPVAPGGLVAVSDNYMNNHQFYQHIYEYAVNEDGSYSLKTTPADVKADVLDTDGNEIFGGYTYWGVPNDEDDDDNTSTDGWQTSGADNGHYTAGNNVIDLDGADVTRGESTIWGDGNDTVNKVVATNSTVFAYLNADGYTYTVYTGKDNAPSVKDAHICAQLGANGYAAFVLVKGHLTTDSSTFWGLLTSDRVVTTKYIGGQLCNGYYVYRLGETSPITVFTASTENIVDTVDDNGTFEHYGVGFYEMTIDGNGQLINKVNRQGGTPNADIIHKLTMAYLTNPYQGTGTPNNNLGGLDVSIVGENDQRKMDTVAVATRYADGSFMGAKYDAGDDYNVDPLSDNGYSLKVGNELNDDEVKDYSVNADTKVIVLGMNISAFRTRVIDATNDRSDPNEKYGPATVAEGTVEDIRQDAMVWVDYTTTTRNGGRPVHVANTVYVLQLPNDYDLAKACDDEDWVLENEGKKVVEEPDNCYYATVPSSETSVKEALRLAVANAKTLSLSELTANAPGGNLYDIDLFTGANGADNYALVVFNNENTIKYARFEGETSYTIPASDDSNWDNQPLSVGNYIVIATTPTPGTITGFTGGVADAVNTTATHFVVFEIVR